MMSYNRFIIERKLKDYLEEDCSYQDVSSKLIASNSKTTAKIRAKNKGYVSGLEELKILYEILNVEIILKKKDGEKVKKGDIVVELSGSTRDILLGERTILNLITHMSAITSTTRKYVNLIRQSRKSVRIACTRKTIPGLRIFEKKAVELGGGDTHRFSLDDMLLVKDTHLKFYNGDVEKLLSDAKDSASFSKKIEIEIEKIEDVLIAARNGADIIMLDNMTPDQAKEAMGILEENSLRDKVIIEISGGINSQNFEDYLLIEPDIISSGELTLFPTEKLDLSLRFD